MTQEDSPSTPRKRSSGFGDRFIPARSSVSRQNYTLNDGPPSPTTPSSKKRPPSLLDNGTREPKLIGLAGGEVDAVKGQFFPLFVIKTYAINRREQQNL